MRFYQSKLEMSELLNMKAEEKLKEINHVFMIWGITLSDLKDSCKNGFKFNSGPNLKSFEVTSMVTASNIGPNAQKNKLKNRKCTLKQSVTMGSTKSKIKKQFSMSSRWSNERSLDYSSSDSFKSEASSNDKKSKAPVETDNYNINIAKPDSEKSTKSLYDEITQRLGCFDQIFSKERKEFEMSVSDYDEILSPMKPHERNDYEDLIPKHHK